jgi:hypothetical protein
VAKVENVQDAPVVAFKLNDQYWISGDYGETQPAPYMSTGYRNHVLMFGRTFWMGVL